MHHVPSMHDIAPVQTLIHDSVSCECDEIIVQTLLPFEPAQKHACS
jgi:hypothetical protein